MAKVVQEVGQFGPKVFENRMLRDESLSVESGVPMDFTWELGPSGKVGISQLILLILTYPDLSATYG